MEKIIKQLEEGKILNELEKERIQICIQDLKNQIGEREKEILHLEDSIKNLKDAIEKLKK